MISKYRKTFNEQFTQDAYENLLKEIVETYKHRPKFKISETPVFIPNLLKDRLIEACNDIMEVIDRPDFKEMTQGAFLNESVIVPHETGHPRFIQLDFGICADENGDPTPKLIELQGFPTLYFYQDYIGKLYKKHFNLPEHLTIHPLGITSEEFIERLRHEIVADADPKQVVLLEVEPDNQATAIDFYCTEAELGIKILCITDLKKRGRELFYLDEDGNEVRILRIYNRIIFDELYQRPDLRREFDFCDEVDVEWTAHPNWFFRISKYTLPLLKGPYVPKSFYLDQAETLPTDLENYVLKPLYSFAGAGVEIHVTKDMIDGITNKANYLLQEKVAYHPFIETPDGPSKCEIRMLLLYNSTTKTTEIVSNLARLSKGEMIGVKYNKDKTWVGGSVGLFE